MTITCLYEQIFLAPLTLTGHPLTYLVSVIFSLETWLSLLAKIELVFYDSVFRH